MANLRMPPPAPRPRATPPICPVHLGPLTCAACTGMVGGKAKSPAKSEAAARNIAKRWAKRAAARQGDVTPQKR